MSIKHDTELSFAEFNSYMHYEIMYQNLSLCHGLYLNMEAAVVAMIAW